MKTKLCFLGLIFLMILISCKNENTRIKTHLIKIDAPFAMPEIITPDFSKCKKISIEKFGAVQGDKALTTLAISKAIDKANKIGGGVVVIPEGEWLTGKIHFKSNVNLHLNEGAVLIFSDNVNDYLPAVHTTWEGLECFNYSPLIYAYECENIAITGTGKLMAKMTNWEKWFDSPVSHMQALIRLYYLAAKYSPVEERQMANDSARMRPQFIQFNRCKNILVENVSIENSPFWVVHPYMSENVVIRNVNIKAHGNNNDGVDPEMSQNVLIENCTFDQGDDAIAVKSGRDQDAWRLNTPSKNIVVRNCTIKNGHQLLAIGSELSGGIENIFVDNCIVTDEAVSGLFHILFIKTNERRGGYVKNIFVSNIKAGKIKEGILGIDTDVLYQWRDIVPTIERRLTRIENINLKNIMVQEVQFISRIQGQEELFVKDVLLQNVSAVKVHREELIHQYVENFTFLKNH